MAHYDFDHRAQREQQAPSLLGENSDRNHRENSGLDDHHDAGGIVAEADSAENNLSRIDD